MLTARSVALEALLRGGDAAEHLDRELRKAELRPADRALATELAYGTLKMRRSLEWSIGQCLTRQFAELEPRVRWILLMGAYQILFLDRIPVHSAVDESVRLARARGHAGTAGLTNAVLRKVAQLKPRPPLPSPEGGAQSLGLFASLPDWIAAHLIDRFGFSDAVRVAAGMNGPPRRALRVDVAARPAQEFIAMIAADGTRAHEGRYGIPESIVVDALGNGRAVHEAIESGLAAWQSEESQLAVHLLDPRPGEVILDACCGRGVKTVMIARRLARDRAVWSIDDDERKLAKLSKTATAFGLDGIRVVNADARGPYPRAIPRFVDAAIVDAPCSGIGILGRRPDARWRKRESDPGRFAPVQAAVLTAAADRVRPGGRLLYVTCSTHVLEDESTIDAFLAAHGDWHAVPLHVAESDMVRKVGNYVLTLPGVHGSDGFFYALLIRG